MESEAAPPPPPPELRRWAAEMLEEQCGAGSGAYEAAVHAAAPSSVVGYCGTLQRVALLLRDAPAALEAKGVAAVAAMDAPRFGAIARDVDDRAQREHAAERRHSERAELERLSRDPGGGALRCIGCGGDTISVQQKQTRSADEGMTVFCSCDVCGRHWRMS